jgi:hypothetical protein
VKSDLFALQLEAHTGGGYELFLAEQPVMATPPKLLAYSRQVQDLVPIDEGIEGMRRRGIGYVVTASESDNTMSGSQVQFHAELGHMAGQLAEFTGGPWVRPGPTVRVYRIAPAGQSNPATASSLSNPKTVTPSASTLAPNP